MGRTRSACALLVVVLVLVLPARPASAEHVPPPGSPAVGSGTVEGTELLEDQTLNGCFTVVRQIFGWQGQGTYAGKAPGGQDVVYRAELGEGQALHEGPLRFTVDARGPYYHGISGTHGMTDSSCAPATAGSPITGVAFSVFAEGHVYKLGGGGAPEPCTGVGSFARLGADFHAQWALDGDCVVVGNEAGTPGTGIAKAQTVHTHEGTHEGCGGSCVDNFKLSYTQHPPVEGLAVNVAGPTSRALNRSVALTAVVAYDGAPLSGSSVTFSVTGPAAASPSATLTTDASGQVVFTFTAAVEGDYVVTATATSPAHPGEEKSTTHTVFFSGPRPVMTLDSMPRVQNGDPATVVAKVVDESDPVANTNPRDPVGGVVVSFSVAAPVGGQATPTSGTATTNAAQGRATFTFTADRAGDYTVTATASYAGVAMSATRTVHFDVKTMSLAGGTDLAADERSIANALMDPAGTYGYLVVPPFKIVKVDLATFQRVGALTLSLGAGNSLARLAAIDPAGQFAYVATTGSSTNPSRIVKVDLTTFQQVGLITLPAAEYGLTTVAIDPAGSFAYFGKPNFSVTSPAGAIKIDLSTFQRVGFLPLLGGGSVSAAVIDPAGRYAYFGTEGLVATVFKVELSTFTQVGMLQLADDEWNIYTAVLDPKGDHAYLGVSGASVSAKVVKVDLDTFQRVGALELTAVGLGPTSDNVGNLRGTAMDPAGRFAYFTATAGSVNVVIKVDLHTFEVLHVIPQGSFATASGQVVPAVIDPAGENLYLGQKVGSGASQVGHVVKVDLTRTPKAALVAGVESYATPYVTPLAVAAPGVLANDLDTEDADPLVTFQPSDPAGGRVSMNPDGSFTYTPDSGFSGTDTFTYQSSDGRDLSAPATVTITVGAPPQGVQSVSGGACGYYTNVGLFGGPPERKGCGQLESATPTSSQVTSRSASVSLPATGSAGTLAATKPAGAMAMYGPAALFSGIWPEDSATPSPSGPQRVDTVGTTGPGGSVSSSAHVVLHDTPLPVRCDGDPAGTTSCMAPGGIGPGPLIADEAHSTCTASESGLSGTATFVNGVVETKYDADTQLPVVTVPIPANPPPNFTLTGTLDHVGDSFRVVLNEQILGPDTITVNAAHIYLLGPTAVGELVVGQSRCGVERSAPNTAPVAADDAFTVGAGQALRVPAAGVLANDSDADGDSLRASTLAPVAPPGTGGGVWVFPSDPAHGTLSLSVDGSFTYTPDPGHVGADSFIYQAQDARGASDTATVNLTVVPAPVAADDGYTTTEDVPLVVTAPGVLANDTGSPLTAVKLADPAHGTLTVGTDGSFTYAPDANFNGTDTFTYTVSDGSGGTDTGLVTVTVTAAADNPVAVDDVATTSEDTAVTIAVLANDTDADGGTLTVIAHSLSSNGTVTLNANGSLAYTPNANFSGPDSFTYTVTDGTGTDAGQVNISVTATNGSAFHPLTPTRIIDTRPAPNNVGPYTTAWGPGTTRDVTVTGGAVPAGADAVTLNVTVTDTTGAGFLTIWPKGQAQPVASNLNWAPGQTIPNAVTVKVGASGQISINNPVGSTQVIIDIVGYYDGQPGDGYTPLDPARILDSRPAPNTVGPFSTPWGPGTTRQVPVAGVGGVPANADAVVLNATVTNTTAHGFLTIWPNGQAQPTASSLNWAPGQTIPNAVTVKVGTAGQVSVFNAVGNANVIFDVVGYFAPNTGHLFHPVNPARVLDTRPAPNQVGPHTTPWGPATNRDVPIGGQGGVPANAAAALLNVTVTGGTDHSFLSIWPAGQPAPLVSSLNWAPGVTIPNSVTTKLGAAGAITIRNHAGTVHVIADTNGWYG